MDISSPSDPRTFAIIGAAMEVHRQLGSGFLEAVYQAAMVLELSARNIPFQREVELPVFYKGQKLDVFYRADFICFDTIVVELKALSKLTGVEESQLINYLKATSHDTGLLINFGAKSLEYKRFTMKPILNPQITPIKEDYLGCARTADTNLCKSVKSVDATPGSFTPQTIPIPEDFSSRVENPNPNLCKSVESVDRSPDVLGLESVNHDESV